MNSALASSFADPADLAGFRAAVARGLSDREAFAFGDNGIGKWGDSTTDPARPACALPPEDWQPLGTSARGALVRVELGHREVICELLDTMPARRNIRNHAGIDLNPAACEALGLSPPVLVDVRWEFVRAAAPPLNLFEKILTAFFSQLFRKL